MIPFAFISFVIAAVLAFVVAIGASITGNDAAWSVFFATLGLALAYLPPIRRGQ